MNDPDRHHAGHAHLAPPFGPDRFGVYAERFARFFGTPKFLIGQTAIVAAWIALNTVALIHHWDVYPFILLNLLFSTQAAYAAPLILLAATRQADRDKATAAADARHRQELADAQTLLLSENTELTRQVHVNTGCLEELHRHMTALSGHFGLGEPAGGTPPNPARRKRKAAP
jgi:uncharacterized membrane protein